MRYFFLLVLFLHVVMEGGLGLVIAVSPRTLTPDAATAELAFVLNYGFAAIAMATVVAWYWPHRSTPLATTITLGILATFHTAEALAGVQVARFGGGPQIIYSHGAFAIAFWVLWSQRGKLTSR